LSGNAQICSLAKVDLIRKIRTGVDDFLLISLKKVSAILAIDMENRGYFVSPIQPLPDLVGLKK